MRGDPGSACSDKRMRGLQPRWMTPSVLILVSPAHLDCCIINPIQSLPNMMKGTGRDPLAPNGPFISCEASWPKSYLNSARNVRIGNGRWRHASFLVLAPEKGVNVTQLYAESSRMVSMGALTDLQSRDAGEKNFYWVWAPKERSGLLFFWSLQSFAL